MLMALFGGSAFFIGLKWRAVMQRSEAAKKAGAKDVNYSVAPGRSGTSPYSISPIPFPSIQYSWQSRYVAWVNCLRCDAWLHRWRYLMHESRTTSHKHMAEIGEIAVDGI
jgi:hypothetical protein